MGIIYFAHDWMQEGKHPDVRSIDVLHFMSALYACGKDHLRQACVDISIDIFGSGAISIGCTQGKKRNLKLFSQSLHTI